MGIGARIRELRIHADLTPADLCERAGLVQSYLSELENGRYDLDGGAKGPTLRTLMKIAVILGCRVEDFLSNGDYPEYDAHKHRLRVPPAVSRGRAQRVRGKCIRRMIQLINRLDEGQLSVALRVLAGYVRGVLAQSQQSSGLTPPTPRSPSAITGTARGKRRVD